MNGNLGKTLAALTALILVHLVTGCKDERFSLNFSHETHVVENELTCDACHQQTEGGVMGRPAHENCSVCHEIDEANPSTECLLCHRVTSAEEIEVRYPRFVQKDEIAFSHEGHAPYAGECVACHVRVSESTTSKDNLLPVKEACLSCHDDATAPLEDCGLCHVESSPVNATHKADWEVQHGLESRFGNSKCMTCHREDTCIQCHQDEKPRDHNNTWRKLTHGAEAAWNRGRCMVCHQEDFCSRCHRNTEPRSHSAGWATGPVRHCSQCHFPLAAAACSVCHEQAEHPSAIDSPHPPFNGFICEECHPTPAGIFPPHQDPGFDCTICHER
ncbi:MAG: hypothetical protein Kow0099_16100 [Candidatus Abyssubacteria bacterium]